MSYDRISSSTATTSNLNYPGLPGSSVSSTIEYGSDRDWHRVGLIAGRTYQFDVSGNSLRDTTLYLRNGSGGYISYDDDGGPGYNSRITYTATETGTYYLDVGSFDRYQTGSYTVSAADTSPGYLGPALYPSGINGLYPGLWPAGPVTQEINQSDLEISGGTTGVVNQGSGDVTINGDISVSDVGAGAIVIEGTGNVLDQSQITTTNIDQSTNNTWQQTFTLTINGDGNSIGDIGAMNSVFDRVGTGSAQGQLIVSEVMLAQPILTTSEVVKAMMS